MRVLVTGSQGCIGSWIVKKLLDRGVDVLTFDVDPGSARLDLITRPSERSRVSARTGDIQDTAMVKSLVKSESISHIVHLAAQLIPFCQSHPVAGGLINVIGTLNVFEAARDAGSPVRVVYASSAAVWGPEEEYGSRDLSGDETLKPATHYGVFKQANEGNARVFFTANGISSVGLRPWSVYGVGRDRGLTADPTIAIKAAALGVPFRIRLSGYVNLQYVEDVAETFIASLLSDVEGAHVFNLAGDVIRVADFIAILERLRPGAGDLISADGPQVPVAYRMDDSQLRSTISAVPHTQLEDGVLRTLTLFDSLKGEGRLSPALVES